MSILEADLAENLQRKVRVVDVKSLIVFFSYSTVCLLYFVLHFRYSNAIFADHPDVLAHSYRIFLENPLSVTNVQSTFVQGAAYPVFLFFWIFGLEPGVFRLSASVLMSISMFFVYRSYHLVLGWRTATLGVLMLLLIPYWVRFNIIGFYYVFFASILLYLVIKYIQEKKSIFLYLIALISGFGGYLKNTYWIFLAGFTVSYIIFYRSRIKELDLIKISAFFAVFLIGSSPFWIFLYFEDFNIIMDDFQSGNENIEDLKPLLILENRFDNLNVMLESYFDIFISVDYQYSVFLLVLIFGMVLSILRKDFFFTMAFLIPFFLLFYTVSTFAVRHLTISIIILPLIVLKNFELLSEYRKAVEIILIFALILHLPGYIDYMDKTYSENEPGDELEFNPEQWRHFSDQDSSHTLFTNSRLIYHMALFDGDIKEVKGIASFQPNDFDRRFVYSTEQIKNRSYKNATFYLKKGECEETRLCGDSARKIKNDLNLKFKENTSIKDETYGKYLLENN